MNKKTTIVSLIVLLSMAYGVETYGNPGDVKPEISPIKTFPDNNVTNSSTAPAASAPGANQLIPKTDPGIATFDSMLQDLTTDPTGFPKFQLLYKELSKHGYKDSLDEKIRTRLDPQKLEFASTEDLIDALASETVVKTPVRQYFIDRFLPTGLLLSGILYCIFSGKVRIWKSNV